mgnify:CR=1 FL=1
MAEETAAADTYSPLLAKMLRMDPEKVASVSLSALGRQAMGSDSEEYRAAKSEVDAAREAMVKALTDQDGSQRGVEAYTADDRVPEAGTIRGH